MNTGVCGEMRGFWESGISDYMRADISDRRDVLLCASGGAHRAV